MAVAEEVWQPPKEHASGDQSYVDPEPGAVDAPCI